MSAFRALFCCAGSSTTAPQGTRNLDLDDGEDGLPSPYPPPPPHDYDKSQGVFESESENEKTHVSSPNQYTFPGGNLGHRRVSISSNSRPEEKSSNNEYIDTPPPRSPERMNATAPPPSPPPTELARKTSTNTRPASIMSGNSTLLQAPASPLPKRSLELTHERMVSSDWGDSLLTAMDRRSAVVPPQAVKEEEEPVVEKEKEKENVREKEEKFDEEKPKTVTPSAEDERPSPTTATALEPCITDDKTGGKETNALENYTRESVVVVDEKLAEFAWTATARMSVIIDNDDNNKLDSAPPRSTSDDASFNPTPRRNSALSTYSSIIAPAAAAAALSRHSSLKRPSSPSILNPSFSRSQTPSNRFSAQSKSSSIYPPSSHRFSGQSLAPRPFSALSITESAYSTDSSRTATPEPQIPRQLIAPAEHPLLEEHVQPLKTILLPALDALLANTSILESYSVWEKAMGLRREVRAFLASGLEEWVVVVEGEVVGVKEGVQKVVGAFVERGDEVRRGAGGAGAAGRGEGLERVRSFWVERE
ncbi:hypothetical protein EX30DRAFT_388630 [Ascodesmis nigricans]|uniref:Uncharacterized protein n=1 Tax=Ascodesmis nigricans TaxID=341454 RepID=A0A4S2MZU4_9PEZI|nr:hypothetical protein EX30DRAFT_388630 [Ascodesmis nigricans]